MEMRQSKAAAAVASDDDPETNNSNNSYGKNFPKTDFPWLMHNFVNEASKEYPDIVSWSSNGAYFQIQNDDKGVLQDILTQYFQRTFNMIMVVHSVTVLTDKLLVPF
jgi:hypothetical protein